MLQIKFFHFHYSLPFFCLILKFWRKIQIYRISMIKIYWISSVNGRMVASKSNFLGVPGSSQNWEQKCSRSIIKYYNELKKLPLIIVTVIITSINGSTSNSITTTTDTSTSNFRLKDHSSAGPRFDRRRLRWSSEFYFNLSSN